MPIRPAAQADAPQIAAVHVASWQTTYAGMLPDEFLAGLSAERRTPQWERILERTAEGGGVFVAEDPNGGIVGFAHVGLPAELPEYEAILYSIYLLKSAQGQGLGKGLLCAAAHWLIGQGYRSMMLWVLDQNPTVRFYEAMGGKPIGQKADRIGETQVIELGYGWSDVGVIAAQCE